MITGIINSDAARDVTKTIVRIVSLNGKSVGVVVENAAVGVSKQCKNAMERIARISCVRTVQRIMLVVTVTEQDVPAVQPLTNATEMNATK